MKSHQQQQKPAVWIVWEDVQPSGQSSETPATVHLSQTTTTSFTTTTTTYNCTTTKVHHQPSIHVNGRCCGTLQHQNARGTAPRPSINRPPPPPTIDEELPHQTPRIQVPGCHHDCVPQDGRSERGHTTTSYPNFRNDCFVCSRYCTATSTTLIPTKLFELNGSGWVLSNFQNLELTLWQLDPLRGSALIPLPRWIQARKDVVNVAGTGDDCFKWAILAGMHPVDVHADREGKYVEHMGKYDSSSLVFPVPFQSVGSFTQINNMSINVYGVDDDHEVIYPLRVSSTLVPDRHVDLLLFQRDGVQHYATIRNFSRLVGRQLSNHGHTVHCCRWYLHAYSSQEFLDTHALDSCHAQRTKFPKDTRCRITNIQKQLLAPFVIYADFESIVQWVGVEAMDTTQGVAVGDDKPTPAGPFQEHLSCRFAYNLVSNVIPDLSMPLVSYRGENAGEMFVRKLQEEADQLFQEYIATPQQLLALTDAELRSFRTATNCHICNQPLGGDKVRDHCHIVGT